MTSQDLPPPEQGVGIPTRSPAPPRIGYGLLLGASLCVEALAVGLVWRALSSAPFGLDQMAAYAIFLLVAAAGPVVVAQLGRRLATPLPTHPAPSRPGWMSPIVVSLVLAAIAGSTASVTYRIAFGSITHSVNERLQAVALIKQSLVKTWLDDAREDLSVTSASPDLRQALTLWRSAPAQETAARERLLVQLKQLARSSHYVEVSLRDASSGALQLSTGADADTVEARQQSVAAAASTRPVLEDFHLATRPDIAAPLRLGYFGPISLAERDERFVLEVSIDPTRDLFPLIEQWPGSAGTAEVLLMRQEGDALLVLNDMRELRQATHMRRVPTSAARSFAAMLTKGTGGGAIEGEDDRANPVLAYAVPVAGTPWFLVAKINQAEAYAELNRVALLAASVAGAALLLGAWWWVETRRYLVAEQRYQLERAEHASRLAELSRRVVSVQEDERRRWSSELHDRIGANLAALRLNLKAMERSIPVDAHEDNELLTETSQLLGETVMSVRDLCSTLRPPVLDYAGLVPALENLVEQSRRRSGIAAHFDHARFNGRCTTELESALFRIAQEALLNCIKHAQASHVTVMLEGSPTGLHLVIEDDGVGFDPARLGETAAPGGHGLLSMRERAAFSGARLALSSAPGRGTRISVDHQATVNPAQA